ncbi:MAG: glycosyltransferase [Desulfovibrio sp.]|nr:glycosyltransferase [Desulfovibrio sp.]MBI4957965.1 glycosyltransferase [Desulfovibrio sp.]
MRIMLLNTFDAGGGAENICRGLCEGFVAQGKEAWLIVGAKNTSHPRVIDMGGGLPTVFRNLEKEDNLSECDRLRLRDRRKGLEEFRQPHSARLLDFLPDGRPDVVAAHNLHGGYFDLRLLPKFSAQVPFTLTLHDAWLLAGNCAHSFDCERWKSGCGKCPNIRIYPGLAQDSTEHNWRRKKAIFARSRLYVTTPSNWLMDKVVASILAPAVAGMKVIPNGVDLKVFRPGSRAAARQRLGIPPEAKVVLFAATSVRQSMWRDWKTMRLAVACLAERLPDNEIIFLALGEDAPNERHGRADVRFVPFVNDPTLVAEYYRAADIYVHATCADTFPTVVLEALACGTPVAATAVGGIPEQIRPLGGRSVGVASGVGSETATGILSPPGDYEALAQGLAVLLSDSDLRTRLGLNAALDAVGRFDREIMVKSHLEWLEEVEVNFAAWRKE